MAAASRLQALPAQAPQSQRRQQVKKRQKTNSPPAGGGGAAVIASPAPAAAANAAADELARVRHRCVGLEAENHSLKKEVYWLRGLLQTQLVGQAVTPPTSMTPLASIPAHAPEKAPEAVHQQSDEVCEASAYPRRSSGGSAIPMASPAHRMSN